MISEGLCDVRLKTGVKMLKIQRCITEMTFYSVLIVILNCKNISQNDHFFCIFDQIDTAYSCVSACVWVFVYFLNCV